MTDESDRVPDRSPPTPDDFYESLENYESDYLNRLLLLLKATEQRAKMLSEEITSVMAKLGLSLRHRS